MNTMRSILLEMDKDPLWGRGGGLKPGGSMTQKL